MRVLAILVGGLLASSAAFAHEWTGPSRVNGRALTQPDQAQPYSLWIAGHSYGKSVYPIASLGSNSGLLNSIGASGLVLLGDTVEYPTPIHLRVLRQFADALDMPVFIAPGNHDQREPGLYEREFGPTHYEFRLRNDLYLVFDFNLAAEGIPADRLAHYRESLESAASDPQVRNVIVLTHHLVWAIDDERLEMFRSRVNYPADYREGVYARELEPALHALAEHKRVFWFSGDRTQFPPAFWSDLDGRVTFFGTGLEGKENDGIVRLDSNAAGEISLSFVSLAGRDLGPIERYGPEYWREFYDGKLGTALIDKPRSIGSVRGWMFVSNRRFVAGAVAGFLAAVAGATAFRLLRARRAGAPTRAPRA